MTTINLLSKCLLFFCILTASCLKVPEGENPAILPQEEEEGFESLNISDQFDYATTRRVEFTIEAVDGSARPLTQVPLEIFQGHPDDSGLILDKGITNDLGESTFSLELASGIDTLFLATYYIGLPNLYKLYIGDSPQSTYTIGDEQEIGVYVTQTLDRSVALASPSNKRFAAPAQSATFSYMGGFNSQGDPDYILEEPYEFTDDILSIVNASLPERRPVPTYNPQYIASGTDADLKLSDSAEVIITFIHEGAGFRNGMGYYTYDLNNPPNSADEISELNIIFPNASYNGSGGGLSRGERVNLGNFSPNTGIGFFVVPNGWNASTQTVVERSYQHLKYSNAAFNDFTSEADRSHTVLLNDEDREILIIGMEDLDRPGGDKDFNDAVFLLQATPYSSIITANLAEAQVTGDDADADGVTDTYDEYPNDPDLAFNSYYPGENTYGTLAYEDLWPQVGDYDMNDIVIKYNYKYEVNAAGKVKNIDASFRLEAMGAGYKNGFGIELELSPSAVSSVTGTISYHNILSLASNGVENGQSKAVIIAFDNGYRVMGRSDGKFVNTEPEAQYVTPVTVPIRIELSAPVDKSSLGTAPYNPFIFTELRRGYEIHLPDQAPTDLADTSLFGTENDDSNPATGKYYKTSNNAMWALHIPIDLPYPKEQESILKAYTRLKLWSTSLGTNYPDWYSNSSYRDYNYIFQP